MYEPKRRLEKWGFALNEECFFDVDKEGHLTVLSLKNDKNGNCFRILSKQNKHYTNKKSSFCCCDWSFSFQVMFHDWQKIFWSQTGYCVLQFLWNKSHQIMTRKKSKYPNFQIITHKDVFYFFSLKLSIRIWRKSNVIHCRNWWCCRHWRMNTLRNRGWWEW